MGMLVFQRRAGDHIDVAGGPPEGGRLSVVSVEGGRVVIVASGPGRPDEHLDLCQDEEATVSVAGIAVRIAVVTCRSNRAGIGMDAPRGTKLMRGEAGP